MSQTHSWWVLSCLAILGRLHWIDRKKLTEFILASQDHETGGISDRPGDLPDPFHTLVSFCSVLHTGISCQNLFHSTIIPAWKVSWVSKEAKKLKELEFVCLVRCFSAKME